MTSLSHPSPNLTIEEVEVVRRALGRDANSVEWAMIDVEWSEHCSYKSSRSILSQFPNDGDHVLVGPGYDAGVVDVGEGYVVTLHIESHNHPSSVDPYGGAATGIGGVLRDILCMGTRPIALIDPLRFGNIYSSLHSNWLFKNVIRGIADYGNCVGVPTVAGEVEFDESFETNCLVDVACIGIGKKDDLVLAEAKNDGDILILAGGSTGRDGIHGSTFASKPLSKDSGEDRAAVQVPDPFMKKLIIEATLEVLDTGYVSGLKDLGGGGLTCGLSEMAHKGGTGVDVDLSLVNLREPDMISEEIMISESQERMLFVVEKGREEKVLRIFDKYGISSSIIGNVTSDGLLRIRRNGSVIASLPVGLVVDAPIISREASKPDYLLKPLVSFPPQPTDLGKSLLKMMSSPNIVSKEWIYRQYDHEVGIRTVVKPGETDAAVLKLPNGKFLAIKSDGNSKHCYLDPYQGAAGCVSESCRNIIAVGANPLAIVDHLQFGDPGKSDVFWTFCESVRGIADYCKNVNLPVIGGKVSFYNEGSSGEAIKPSPVAVIIGIINKTEEITTMKLKNEGDLLIILGKTNAEMGGSEYYEQIHRLVGGKVPKVDMGKDVITFDLIKKLISKSLVEAVHDCSKGGFGIALAEMCLKGKFGASVDVNRVPSSTKKVDEILFSESHGRFLLEVSRDRFSEVEEMIHKSQLEFGIIGEVLSNKFIITNNGFKIVDLPIGSIHDVWANSLPVIMGDKY